MQSSVFFILDFVVRKNRGVRFLHSAEYSFGRNDGEGARFFYFLFLYVKIILYSILTGSRINLLRVAPQILRDDG